MRRIRNILIGVVCCMLLMPTVVSAVSKPEKWGKVDIENSQGVPKCKAGDPVSITIPLINRENYPVTDVVVSPKQDKDVGVYPFTTPATNVYEAYDPMAANGGTASKVFSFEVREDALSGRYEIKFKINYTMNVPSEPQPVDVSITKSIFVDVEGLEVEPTETPPNEGSGGGFDDGGGYSGGGDAGSTAGSDADKKTAKPRVVIDGFRTEPKVVRAGASFKLILEVRNTSKKTAVSNMEINLQAAGAGENTLNGESTAAEPSDTFLPDKGSNTLYVDSLKANTTKEVSIDLTARADLQQRPYSIGISMAYEDSKAEEYQATSNISIPITQEARLDISKVEVMPESIEVGDEGNVTFSIYNLGKTKLYNVKVELADDTVSGGEAFIGNLEAGATGEVDVMITGEAETTDDGGVKIVVSYEDQDGNKDTYDASCNIFVMPTMDEGEMMLDEGMEMPEEAGGLSMPAKVGIGVGAIVVATLGTVGVIKRKRKKEEDFTDELLGSDKNERK